MISQTSTTCQLTAKMYSCLNDYPPQISKQQQSSISLAIAGCLIRERDDFNKLPLGVSRGFFNSSMRRQVNQSLSSVQSNTYSIVVNNISLQYLNLTQQFIFHLDNIEVTQCQDLIKAKPKN